MSYFITGTDTDIGKTVASAWAMLHLDADYWKPVQSGLDYPTDIDAVKTLTGFDDERFFSPAYELTQPLSPHESARIDGININLDSFELPKTSRPLIAEGAGGLLVPLNDKEYVIDLIAKLGLEIILVCKSGLGTINHTLLSIEAIRLRNLPLKGVIINGKITPHNRKAIEYYGNVKVIAEIDYQENLNKETLLSIKPEISDL